MRGNSNKYTYSIILDDAQVEELMLDLKDGMTKARAEKEYGVSHETILRIQKRVESGKTQRYSMGNLMPCGTVAAYKRHIRKKERPCFECCEANSKYVMKRSKLKPCGTEAAYRRHTRKGQKPCNKCIKGRDERRKERGE